MMGSSLRTLGAFALAVVILLAGDRSLFAQWTTPLNVSNTDGRFSVAPNLDFDSTGGTHLAFSDFLDSSRRIYYANDVAGFWQRGHIADGKGVRVLVTPDDTVHLLTGESGGIYHRTKPVNGSWSARVRVDAHNPAESTSFVYGAKDSSGGIYVMWLHLYDSQAGLWGRYKPLGGSWGAIEQIRSASSSDNDWPMESWLGTDGTSFYATWRRKNTMEVRYRQRSAGGWGTEKSLHNPSRMGVLAFDPTSNEMAAIYTQDDNRCSLDFRVWAKFSYDGGNTWTTPEEVSNNCWISRSQRATYDASGRLHVAYERKDTDPEAFNVWLRTREGGAWGPHINFTANQLRSGMASGAITARGDHLYLLFTQTLDGFEEVYLSENTQSPQGTVTGVVRDQYGMGVSGATVAWSSSLQTTTGGGGVYSLSLPEGTHEVTASKAFYSADSQSGISVTAGQTTSGVDFAISGQPPLDVWNVTHTEGNQQNSFEWLGATSDNYDGVEIRYKTTGPLTGPTDGALAGDIPGDPWQLYSFTHSGLTNGQTYYYGLFAYFADASRHYAGGVLINELRPAGPADLDRDGDVDSVDFGELQACYSGVGIPFMEDCDDADIDNDMDVDMDDYLDFADCVSGPNNPSDPNCVN